MPAPEGLARRLEADTRPESPWLIEFRWSYRGREGRFSGEGAVRVNPPDSVRLDLLGPGWSGVQSAILLGDRVRYIGERRLRLPPPTFMWAMLGVFRPPASVSPEGAELGDGTRLRYPLVPGHAVVFEFDPDGRLVEAERRIGGDAIQRIRVSPGDAPPGSAGWIWPREARYRDLVEFHEVNVEVIDIREHAPFESRIFGVASR